MATFYDTVSIRLTADDTELRARLAALNAQIDAMFARTSGGQILHSLPGPSFTTPGRMGAANSLGSQASRAAAGLQASAMALSPNVRVANARGSISAPVISQIVAETAADVYTFTSRARAGTPAANIAINTAVRPNVATPPAAVTPPVPPVSVPSPGATISTGALGQLTAGVVVPGARGIPGIYGMPPNYVPTVPSVPATLKPPPTGAGVVAGAAGGRALAAKAGPLGRLAGKAGKMFSSPKGFVGGALGLLAVAASHHSQYNNDYFRELMTTPGSTPDYKPYSSAWDSAVDFVGEAFWGTGSSAVFGLMAFFADVTALAYGEDDMTRRKWGLAFELAHAEFKHTTGLDQEDWQQANKALASRQQAYNRLRDASEREAGRAADQMAAAIQRMGFGGTNTVEEIAGVFRRDPKFKNEFFREIAQKFQKDNPISNIIRMADPYGVTRQ